MNREEAKNYVRQNASQYLKADKTKKGYICPLCGSGTGPTGTGITTKDGVHYTCWAGCYTNEDIIDIIGREFNIKDQKEKFDKAFDLFNVIVDEKQNYSSAENDFTFEGNLDALKSTQSDFIPKSNTNTQSETENDYTEFYKQAQANIEKTDYWKKRGLSLDTVKQYGLGYINNWKPPKSPNAPPSPRLIIPTGTSSYLARDVRNNQELTKEQLKYTKQKTGKVQIYNLTALEQNKPVYIVEGELDALSIIEVGGNAIGLGSIGNINKLLEELQKKRPNKPLLLALDTDEQGLKATERLEKELIELNIDYAITNPYNGYKDANEALIKDREAFKEAIEKGESIEAEEYMQKSNASYMIQGFINGIAEQVNTPYIPTGFNELDKALEGGLYEGLYIIGAISSLGKTTFVLQIADQIAQQGQDIIIFSLEMAKYELISKSISRHTYIKTQADGAKPSNAKTNRGITVGSRYQYYSDYEKELIKSSIETYAEYAGNIYIHEGVGDIGAENIKQTVEKHIRITGNKPVVIIDYLQIIAPIDMRASDKQNTDKAVLELKRLSRDKKIPVIGVSSFNRENYKTKASMSAFKESGAIEYGSDVLIGLQFEGVGDKSFDIENAKSKEIRNIEAVLIKNRNGRSGLTLKFEYYPMFNYFKEI